MQLAAPSAPATGINNVSKNQQQEKTCFIIIDCELCDEFYEGDCWEHENLFPIGDNDGPSSSRYVFFLYNIVWIVCDLYSLNSID